MTDQTLPSAAHVLPLQGKVALVTGGSRGLGREMVLAFAKAGADTVIVSRKIDSCEKLASEVAETTGRKALPVACHVGDWDAQETLVEQVYAEFGRVDILVNTSGFTKAIPHADLDALDDAFIDRMFAVNWRGQFATMRELAPLLKASDDALAVFISSIAATNGAGSNIAYCAAKAGTETLVKSLARALAPSIRVMGVSPGVVDTGFVPGRGADFNQKVGQTIPLKRIATADDVADAILACATHLTYATGTTLVVDGGRLL